MDNFNFTGAFDDLLVPPPDQWPAFDSVSTYSFSPTPSPDTKQDALPSAADLAAMPIPPSRASPRNKDPNHIPRPRNAFMLFRSAFAAAQKITSTIEHDNRHITRIIAHCWNRLSAAEKEVWRDKAADEKREHKLRYPDYRFTPTGRGNRRVKRKVRRNGEEDVKRCEKLAELVMAGKLGEELESAIKQIDEERLAAAHVVDAPESSTSAVKSSPPEKDSSLDISPFHSPLLPPAGVPQQVPERDLMFVPLVSIAPLIAPPMFPPQTGLEYVLDPSCQFYHAREGSTSDAIPPLDHFQSVVNFMDGGYVNEQSSLDLSLFAWTASDSFPYFLQDI